MKWNIKFKDIYLQTFTKPPTHTNIRQNIFSHVYAISDNTYNTNLNKQIYDFKFLNIKHKIQIQIKIQII